MLRFPALVTFLTLFPAAALRLSAADGDWPEWRGPGKDGVVADSPPIATAWPEGAPPRAWSVAMPGDVAGNYASPVVVEGQVYCHVSWRRHEPIAERRLDRDLRRAFGRFPHDLPADLIGPIDEARTGEERARLQGREVEAWAREWVQRHLGGEQRQRWGAFVRRHLIDGRATISAATWNELRDAGDRVFAGHDACLAWMESRGIPAADRVLLADAVRTTRPYRVDTLLCLDLEDGAERWRVENPTVDSKWGASNTPCVRDGRVFAVGCAADVIAADAASGEVLWRREALFDSRECDASVTVVGDVLVVPSPEGVFALDPATGETRWRNRRIRSDGDSAARWPRADGGDLILVGGACLDPADGRVRWRYESSRWTTPAARDGVLVHHRSNKSLDCYRRGKRGVARVARIPVQARACSPATDGERIWFGAGDVVRCLRAGDGREFWRTEVPLGSEYSSVTVADGKVFFNSDRGVVVLAAADGELLADWEIPFGECASACIADGRLLARGGEALRCYDLREPR